MTLLEAYILGDMLAIYWCMIKFNVKHCVVETGNLATIYTNGIVLRPNSTWLDSTRHVRRVEPMHFGCVELVEQHSSTRSTGRARLARHDELDWLDMSSSTGATCNLVMITVIHLLFNLQGVPKVSAQIGAL